MDLFQVMNTLGENNQAIQVIHLWIFVMKACISSYVLDWSVMTTNPPISLHIIMFGD